MVPPFTVTYPVTNGSVLIEFDRPTQFNVRPGKDGRSMSVVVPVLPGAKDWSVEVKGKPPANEVTAQPSAPAKIADLVPPVSKPQPGPAAPSVPAPTSPALSTPTAAVSPKPAPSQQSATVVPRTFQAIESIDVQRRGKEAEISIRFAAPIQFVRHAPADSGKLLRIYPRASEAGSKGASTAAETLRLPETDMVPRFTATYPDAENALAIEFDRLTRFTLRKGADDRSINIVVPVLANAQDWSVQVRRPTSIATAPAAPPASPSTSARTELQPSIPDEPVPAPAHTQAAPAIAPSTTAQNLPTLTPLSKVEIEERAKEWIDAAREAIAARNGVAAVARINQVLSLPPNSQTQAAQALMDQARELSGESRRAAPGKPTPGAPAVASTPGAVTPSIAQNQPTLAPLSKDEIESRAKEWMDAARQAITAHNGVIAAARINQILSLPPNSQTEAAQALMGDAREFSGELRRAVAEYEAYLKNYPNGEYAPRVKERLASINKRVAEAFSPSLGLKPGTGTAAWAINGGFSQVLLHGKFENRNHHPPASGPVDIQSRYAFPDRPADADFKPGYYGAPAR